MAMGMGLCLLLTFGCGSQDDSPSAGAASTGGSGATGSAGPSAGGSAGAAESVTERAARYLIGRFDSSEDAAQNPHHFAISLVICRADVPALGSHVLYVEQAKTDALSKPYRQRLYVVEPGVDPSIQARSRVFELASGSDWVGWCDAPTALPIDAADAEEKIGCAVELTFDASTDAFDGGTVGKSCASALAGATYATSDVALSKQALLSWDRGFDQHDTQVWGATDGPYVFARKSTLEE